MMNTRQLISNLKYIGLPATFIAVGGLADEHYCIMPTEEGHWEVFYYERGEKRRRVVVETEDIACTYLWGVLALYQVMGMKVVLAD
jgi:hypothetical protein